MTLSTEEELTSINRIYPKLKIVFCVLDECSWCQKYKSTINMIASLGIRYQIIEDEEQCDVYGADDYGYPLTVLCGIDGYPLGYPNKDKSHYGGYMGLSELMDTVKQVYGEFFTNE